MKVCHDCDQAKPLEAFAAARHNPRTGRTIYQSYCRKCGSARRMVRDRANPERGRAANLRYMARLYKDPERHAIWLEKRRKTSVLPDAERVMVEVAPIRAAVEWAGLTCGEIGGRCGIDESAIRRGLQQDKMNAAKAGKILEAIGSSPAEVGL